MMLFAACKSTGSKTQLLEYEGKFPDESAENMNWDVEYIFKLKYSLTFHEKKNLEIRIRKDLKKFLNIKFELL